MESTNTKKLMENVSINWVVLLDGELEKISIFKKNVFDFYNVNWSHRFHFLALKPEETLSGRSSSPWWRKLGVKEILISGLNKLRTVSYASTPIGSQHIDYRYQHKAANRALFSYVICTHKGNVAMRGHPAKLTWFEILWF